MQDELKQLRLDLICDAVLDNTAWVNRCAEDALTQAAEIGRKQGFLEGARAEREAAALWVCQWTPPSVELKFRSRKLPEYPS